MDGWIGTRVVVAIIKHATCDCDTVSKYCTNDELEIAIVSRLTLHDGTGI